MTFAEPDRTPFTLPAPWGSDVRGVGFDPDPNWSPTEPGIDEWGSVWQTLDKASMGEVKRPAIGDWSELDSVKWPKFVTPERTQTARAAAKKDDPRFLMTSLPQYLWERVNRMRGIEDALADLCAYTNETANLLGAIVEQNLEVIDFMGEIGVDGIISCEDWGLQDRLMINPSTWRSLFKERYAALFGRAQDHGMLVFMHSCGHIVEILDDLIEVGLDVIQLDQQENMGLELLSERFGGRIAFWCPVDIQTVMVYGTIDDVRDYARKLMWNFGRYGGGFIGHWYASPKAVQHDMAKVDAMCEVFAKEGDFPLAEQITEMAV